MTPFYFEAMDQIIERHPHLVDVYVNSSDYPHIEGGKESQRRFYERLAPLGDPILEKFFVTNGELLLPA